MPSSVTNGAAVALTPRHGKAQRLEIQGLRHPGHLDDLDGQRERRTQGGHQLAGVHDDDESGRRLGDELLAQVRAAAALDAVERVVHLVGAIDGDVQHRVGLEGGQRDAVRLRVGCRSPPTSARPPRPAARRTPAATRAGGWPTPRWSRCPDRCASRSRPCGRRRTPRAIRLAAVTSSRAAPVTCVPPYVEPVVARHHDASRLDVPSRVDGGIVKPDPRNSSVVPVKTSAGGEPRVRVHRIALQDASTATGRIADGRPSRGPSPHPGPATPGEPRSTAPTTRRRRPSGVTPQQWRPLQPDELHARCDGHPSDWIATGVAGDEPRTAARLDQRLEERPVAGPAVLTAGGKELDDCRHQVHQHCEYAPLGPKNARSSAQPSASTASTTYAGRSVTEPILPGSRGSLGTLSRGRETVGRRRLVRSMAPHC